MPISTPNYLTYNADGTVTANFSGGVTIDTTNQEVFPFPPPNSVSWINRAVGTIIASVGSISDQVGNATDRLDLQAKSYQAGRTGGVFAQAIGNLGARKAGIQMIADDTPGAGNHFAEVYVFANDSGAFNVKVIDGNGSSDFLRQTSTRQTIRAFGTNIGLGPFATVTIAHGLPAAPVGVFVQSWNTGGGATTFGAWVVGNITATTFQVTNGANSTQGFMWEAWT